MDVIRFWLAVFDAVSDPAQFFGNDKGGPNPANGSKTTCPGSVNLLMKNSSMFSEARTSS